uniref:Uncharacterized protein LOC114340708 n=1 Tax=Diabrotica virgifera virgifera TaxID=50390 RepID=A0A6P7GTX3_DIAVI
MLQTLETETKQSSNKSNSNFKQREKTRTFLTNTTKQCVFCNNDHNIYHCESFLNLTPSERLNKAKGLRLCINCLNNNHSTKQCRSSGCKKCGKVHNTLLHFPKQPVQQTSVEADIPIDIPQANETSSNYSSLTCHSPAKSQILLSTAMVKVADKNGNLHDCRVLLDSASQSNFISQRLHHILQLPKTKTNTSIFGIAQMHKNINYCVSVEMKSTINDFNKKLTCLILPNITGCTPQFSCDLTTLNIPNHITLADKHFYKPANIDLLIGADTFWDLLCIGQIKLGTNYGPMLHKTKLGWIISGPISATKSSNDAQNCYVSTETDFNETHTHYGKFCETYFKETTSQNNDGRFTLPISYKHPLSSWGDSTKQHINLHRFSSWVDFTKQFLNLLLLILLLLFTIFTTTSKIILQKLWRLKISWDESLPHDLHSLWSNYSSQLLSILNDLKIHTPFFTKIISPFNCIDFVMHWSMRLAYDVLTQLEKINLKLILLLNKGSFN